MSLSDLLQLQTMEPRHGLGGDIQLDVLNSACIDARMFNKRPGETDIQAVTRCAQNLAPNAANTIRSGLYPQLSDVTVLNNYFQAKESNLLLTDTPHSPIVYALVCHRCRDATVGSTSDHRGFLLGTFGNGVNFGWGLYHNSLTELRLLTYDTAGTLQTCDKTYVGSPLTLFRIHEVIINATTMSLRDVTDGTAAVTTAIVGHRTGSQTLTYFGRTTTGADFVDSVHKDMTVALVLNAEPTAGEKTTLIAQMRRLIAEQQIVEGT